jgi:DNA mismatch endonuclease (patch repair protein)
MTGAISMSRIQPSSPEASYRMAKVRQKGTGVEVDLRRELYRSGLRYRVGYVVLKRPRRVADVAFPGLKIAIFVDGCFWHGCPKHGTWPKQNAEFWRNKIETNRSRDKDTNVRLEAIGWKAVRVWEHESPVTATKTISRLVAEAKAERSKSPPSLNQND